LAANFETILLKVSAVLGCDSIAISAEFYVLLVYDRDGFFLPNRDTEKTEGMFGTLVVTLLRRIASASCGFGIPAAKSLWIPVAPNSASFLTWRFTLTANTRRALSRKVTAFALVYNLVQKRGKSRNRIPKGAAAKSAKPTLLAGRAPVAVVKGRGSCWRSGVISAVSTSTCPDRMADLG